MELTDDRTRREQADKRALYCTHWWQVVNHVANKVHVVGKSFWFWLQLVFDADIPAEGGSTNGGERGALVFGGWWFLWIGSCFGFSYAFTLDTKRDGFWALAQTTNLDAEGGVLLWRTG
jgi:hypothetical protein